MSNFKSWPVTISPVHSISGDVLQVSVQSRHLTIYDILTSILTLHSPPRPLCFLCSSAGNSVRWKPGRSWPWWQPPRLRCPRKWWWRNRWGSGWSDTPENCPGRAGWEARGGHRWARSTPYPLYLYQEIKAHENVQYNSWSGDVIFFTLQSRD